MKMRRRGMDKIKREAIFCGTSDDPLIARRRFKTIEEVDKGLEDILKRRKIDGIKDKFRKYWGK